MNGLAGSDPVSTQHSSDGGGNCISLCAGPGRSLLQLALSWEAGLLCKSGLMEVSLKGTREGRGGGSLISVCSSPMPHLSSSWMLQACLMLPCPLSREGRYRFS